MKDRNFTNEGNGVIQDNNFDYDAVLIIKGDFVGDQKDLYTQMIVNALNGSDDQRQILSWCGSLEEAKLNGEFEHKVEDSYFLKQVKTIAQLATMDLKE